MEGPVCGRTRGGKRGGKPHEVVNDPTEEGRVPQLTVGTSSLEVNKDGEEI